MIATEETLILGGSLVHISSHFDMGITLFILHYISSADAFIQSKL